MLHLGSREKSGRVEYSRRPALHIIPKAVSGCTQPLFDPSFSSLQDVCTAECVNSVVTVGGILLKVGELRSSSSSTYRTLRIGDPSLVGKGQEYVNLTLWGDDAEYFENAVVGEFILAERVKVIQFCGSLQLSSTHLTLMHTGLKLPFVELMSAHFARFKPTAPPASLPTLQRKNSHIPHALVTNSNFIDTSANHKSKNARKAAEKSTPLITDFFPFERSSVTRPMSPEPLLQPNSSVRSSAPYLPLQKVHPFKRKTHRFAIIDALDLNDDEECSAFVCLVDILARSPRGWCVFDCLVCSSPASVCICPVWRKSHAWTLYVPQHSSIRSLLIQKHISDLSCSYSDVSAVWKDSQHEIVVDMTPSQFSYIIDLDADTFVNIEEELRQNTIQASLGQTFFVQFAKVRF